MDLIQVFQQSAKLGIAKITINSIIINLWGFLSIENSMFNIKTAGCNFLHFYWYSIHFFFSNNFSSKYLLTLTQTSIEMTPDSHLIFKHFYFSSDNEKMRGILPNNFCCDTKDLGRGTHVGANLIGVANPLHVI